MAGLEIYGALAATASLVKAAIEVKKHCIRTAEELKALEQAKISGLNQITLLRTAFKSLALSFDKYNKDVMQSLSEKDKVNIAEIVKDTTEAIEKCKGTMVELKALAKKKLRSKSELDVLRDELNSAITTIQCLQGSFSSLIFMETLRRVSVNQRPPELEDLQPPSRRTTIDSNWSMSTLTPAMSSESTYSTGSSLGSTSSSPDKTPSTAFVASKQLRSAVQDGDSTLIEQLIGQTSTEAEKESWRASALSLACSFRRKSVVQSLLTSNPDVHIIDDSGLGVIHATIGLSEQLSESKERDTADILKLLVNHHSPLIRSMDKQKRQALHYCAMTGNYLAAQYLLSVDRDRINATDSSKKTPLYHICEHHSPNRKLLELLLQNGGHFATRSRPRMKDARLAKVKKMLDEVELKRKLTLTS